MEEIRVKRTDKNKRKTIGGFYSEFKKWRVDGKSSKDLKLMIEDLKNAITHQLVRIKKLKYVIKIYRERDKTKQTLSRLQTANNRIENHKNDKLLLRNKVNRRDKKIDSLDSEINSLESAIKLQDRQIQKLNRELDRKDETISEIKATKRVKQTIVKEVVPKDVKRLIRISNKGINQRSINAFEYLARTMLFLDKHQLSIGQFTTLLQTDMLDNVNSGDLITKSYKILNMLTEKGYLQKSNTSKGAVKYWFVSVKGKELVEEYKNVLSYGKSVLVSNV